MRGRSRERELLLAVLDEAYDAPSWHGPNLRAALRGVSVTTAVWRPAPGRHSVWELALHCAYWKHVVWRRLTGGPRGSFPRRPSNFPAVGPRRDAAAWKADLRLLEERHRWLREAVTGISARRLSGTGGPSSPARLVYGVAAHDLYHAGQIRLLVTLSASRRQAARG